MNNKIFKTLIGCDPKEIAQSIIISPVFTPKILSKTGTEFSSVIGYKGVTHKKTTFIQSPASSSAVGDLVMLLGQTKCRQIIFVGAVGSLDDKLGIGDLIIAQGAQNAEGFSQLLKDRENLFTTKNYIPTETEIIKNVAEYLKKKNVSFKTGKIFTIGALTAENENLLAQIKKKGFVGLDMETSAFLAATQATGIPAIALYYVSDLPLSKPFYKLSPQDHEKTRQARERIVKITLDLATANVLPAIKRSRKAATADEKTFDKLMTTLTPTHQRSKELFALLKEITQRDNLTFTHILKKKEIQSILHDKVDTPQKVDLFYQQLRKIRFPEITAHEERFKQIIKELKLPPHLKITPPPHFEGNKYSAELKFSTPQEIEAAITKLEEIKNNPEFGQLI